MSDTTPAATASAGDLALYIHQKHGIKLDDPKMPYMLYYTQAWSLAILGKPAFREDLIAAPTGPVIRELYGKEDELKAACGCKECDPHQYGK